MGEFSAAARATLSLILLAALMASLFPGFNYSITDNDGNISRHVFCAPDIPSIINYQYCYTVININTAGAGIGNDIHKHSYNVQSRLMSVDEANVKLLE